MDPERAADAAMVDPFLVEALQNPRHRLTILRMELDIQKFMQNHEQLQFEFQHFPTSYLRLAAHRVAQHYGLQTVVQDNSLDGQGTRILVRKVAESRYRTRCLSDLPTKASENDKQETIKIVVRPRPRNASSNARSELGTNHRSARTMEERHEEYEKARARIFSSPSGPELENNSLQAKIEVKDLCVNEEQSEASRNSVLDLEKNLSGDATSRVAIFRDREKDLTDPDYDRRYTRHVKVLPNSQFLSPVPFSLHKFQPPHVQYDLISYQLGQMPMPRTSVGYRNVAVNPFCSAGLDHRSRDAAYIPWPSQSMMYAQSYDQFRHVVFQVTPFCQQPLSFDCTQSR